MTTNDQQQAPTAARTDDLLASSADEKGGARGFEGQATPEALQTGMEGIADATNAQKTVQTDTKASRMDETVQDKAVQVRDQQE